MKECRTYNGFLTVMAFFAVICLSSSCGESSSISGSGDEMPELASSDGAVYVSPSNAFSDTPGINNQKKGKDKKAEPDEVFYEDLSPHANFAILLIYHRGIHERRIKLIFETTISIPEILHGICTHEGSCDNGVPNAAKRKYYDPMIPGTSRATIPILDDGSMDKVYIDVDEDGSYDYVFSLS